METKHKKTKWLIHIALMCLMMVTLTKMQSQDFSACFSSSTNSTLFPIDYSCPVPTDPKCSTCTPTPGYPVLTISFVAMLNPITNSTNYPPGLTFQYTITDGTTTIFTGQMTGGTANQSITASQIPRGNLTCNITSVVFGSSASPGSLGDFDFDITVTTPYTFTYDDGTGTGNTTSDVYNQTCSTSKLTMGLYNVSVVSTNINACLNAPAVFTTTGGNPGLAVGYSWSYPSTALAGSGASFSAPTGTVGTYYYYFAYNPLPYNSGCPSAQTKLTVNISPLPTLNVSPSTLEDICYGQPAPFQLTGSTSYSISSNGATINGANGSFFSPNPAVTTTYTIKGENNGACTAVTVPVTVTVNVAAVGDFSVSSSVTGLICYGTPVTLKATNLNSVGANNQYTWSTNANSNMGNTPSITVTPSVTTTYSCTVTGSNTCQYVRTITVPVANPIAQIGLGSAPTSSVNTVYQCEFGSSAFIVTSLYTNDTYDWSLSGNGAVFSSSGTGFAFGKSVTVNLGSQTGTGNVYVALTSYVSGCSSVTTLTILPCCTTPAGFTQLGAYSGQNMGSASVLNAGTYTGTYLVSGKLLLTGNVTFNGATLEMNPGASIVGGGNLTLNNTHIYACSGMWQGISFINDLTNGGALNNTPVLSVTNSLIEDAIYAANIVNPNAVNGSTNDGATNVSTSFSNAWFNRCAVGIANNFDPLTPVAVLYNTDTVYHSGTINTLSNCVFTCRNGVTMAMVTANNTAALANLAGGALHNYLRTNLNYNAFTGIATDVSALPNSTISTCFFDNVMDGILATGEGNSLTVTNCTFQYNNVSPVLPNYAFVNSGNYCKGQAGGNLGGAPGTFVFHSLTGTGATRAGAGINFFGASLVVGGTSATACSVLNSDYGLISYSNLTVTANKFTGTNNAGVYVNTMNPYGNVENPSGAYAINNNTFTNHYRQGVNAIFMNPAAGSGLGINNNTFTVSTALYATKAAATYTALPEAISVTGSAQGNSFVSIGNNNISNYQLGITALGTYSVNIGTNSISMYDDNVNNTTYTHGISLVNSNGSIVLNNTISASYAAAALKNEQFGIFTTASTNSLIECNHISGPDVSIKCQGPNNISTLANNSFLNAALINFWLELSGNVGPQGVAAGGVSGGITYPKGYSNANIFSNTGSIANGEKPLAAYCSNGSLGVGTGTVTGSPFYYANVSIQTPSPSGNDANNLIDPGVPIPLGGIYQLGTSPPAATTCPSGQRLANTNNDPVLTTAVSPANGLPPILNGNTPYLIAGNTLHAALYDTVACFGNVHDLYRTLLEQGAVYYTADAVLSKFMLTMQGSVHEKLVAADSLLLHAADSVQVNAALLHNNSFTAQGMHDKYLQAVNNLFAAALKQKHGLSATQMQNLKSIAQLCPYQYGEGVFRARALLSRYDDTRYINTCEQPAFPQKPSAIGREETIDGATLLPTAKVSIFPNPNSGSFSISYSGTAKSVSIEVYNTLGALVASQSIANENETSVTQINNLPEGVYMVRLNGDGVPVKIERIIVTK